MSIKRGHVNEAALRHLPARGGMHSESPSTDTSPHLIGPDHVAGGPSAAEGAKIPDNFHESAARFWWEDPQSAPRKPTAGDILVTLDSNNLAEVSLWDKSVVPVHLVSSKRGAWLIVVVDLRVVLTGGQLLPPGWRKWCRCLMTYKLNASGLWMPDQYPKPLFPVNPEEGGLGCAENCEVPSSQNIHVIIHTNNNPPIPPILQADWWRSQFDGLHASSAWVLGVYDSRFLDGCRLRSLTTWIRGSGPKWLRRGECHKSFIPNASSTDRIELGPPVPEEPTVVPSRTRFRPSPFQKCERSAVLLQPSSPTVHEMAVPRSSPSSVDFGSTGTTGAATMLVPSDLIDALDGDSHAPSVEPNSSNLAFASQ